MSEAVRGEQANKPATATANKNQQDRRAVGDLMARSYNGKQRLTIGTPAVLRG
jgi:hypothetical protein